MAGELQPLDEKFAIVGPGGRPTLYFIQWAQQKQIDISNSTTLTDLEDFLAAHELVAGNGIGLAPDGNLNNSPTITAKVQEILDQISAVRGTVLYRGATGWAALAPGAAGQFLRTAGPGADPSWVSAAGAIVADSATVGPAETTASTVYVALTTPGPSVTLTTGASVLVTISGDVAKPGGVQGFDGFMAVEVSGATTIAAADANATDQSYPLAAGGFNFQQSRTFKLTGLTPGVNTFTLKYRCNGGGAWSFSKRDITVIAL